MEINRKNGTQIHINDDEEQTMIWKFVHKIKGE